jgi:hypothetical protein
MKNSRAKPRTREMRAEYDFSGGIRSKYVDGCRRGVKVALIAPELPEAAARKADRGPQTRAIGKLEG